VIAQVFRFQLKCASIKHVFLSLFASSLSSSDFPTYQTRLITRMRAQARHSPLVALASLFIDFAAFLMKRRMLLGIKQRAEMLSKQAKVGAGEDAGGKPRLEEPVR
jgi:hypothetical protein